MKTFDISKFSAIAFEQCGLDSVDSRLLLGDLEAIIAKDIHELIFTYLKDLTDSLNKTGHNLKLDESVYDRKDYPVDISYKDDWRDSNGYHCKLRVAVTSVISTGYSHLIKDEE